MSMNGIDISDYQSDLDLGAIDFNFAIIKATENTGHVQSCCDSFVQKCKALGKCWGFYHFMGEGDPIEQAKHFVDNTKNYFGEGVPVLDYEMYGRIGTDKAKQFLDYVYAQTGVRCIVYMSRSVCTEEDWSQIAPNHALWVAQYADNDQTGYQSDPWLPSGGFGAWDTCAIHQYSSAGRLSGYGSNLDLDKAFMDSAAWAKYANPGGAKHPEPAPQAPKPSRRQVAVDGLWGRETTLALQEHYGLYADGIVSGQNSSFRGISAGCLYGSFEWVPGGGGGSPTIKALQGTVGAAADGFVGPDTWRALIAYGMARGSGAAYNDARLDAPSVTIRWLQRSLNAGTI